MQHLSDKEITEHYLTACVKNIQWLIDQVQIENHQLVMNGWAITTESEPSEAHFLLNEQVFDQMNYPIASPDLGEIFWNIPTARRARFQGQTTIRPETFKEGFGCLEFIPNQQGATLSRQRAWYLPDPNKDLPIPNENRIRRVIGVGDSNSYLIGGASIFKRFEYYLKQQFSQNYSDFKNILDWGCGSGRVLRHFHEFSNSEVWGVDIDGDNIAWCQTHLPRCQYLQIPLIPPTSLPANYFDLIIGISVLTHLNEENQFLWLQELNRIATHGAIIMVSIQGLSQTGLYRSSPALIRAVEEKGFVITGKNNDLDEVMTEQDYYINVIQSRDYIHKEWGKYFTIFDIVDAIAANQDVVVMRNDKKF